MTLIQENSRLTGLDYQTSMNFARHSIVESVNSLTFRFRLLAEGPAINQGQTYLPQTYLRQTYCLLSL